MPPPLPSPNNGPPRVTVVVPVYRNEETLGELHRRLAAVLEKERLSFEILFVDDGSPDGSRAVIEALARRDARVGGIVLGRNVGQHRAVLAGLARARGEIVVALDADLQDPPETVPLLLSRLGPGGAAGVFGGRRGRYESWPRLLTSRFFKFLLRVLARVPGDAGLYFALDRPLLDRVLAFDVKTPFVTVLIGAAGLPLASVPVQRAARPAGSSAYTGRARLRSGLRALACLLQCRLRRRAASGGRPAGEAPVAALVGAPLAPGSGPAAQA